ncbi:hypothetical protein GOV07_05830 [Candidatus Woesearchaeota archaeon]|nr:hypothetical protein [Candidatus Woesearchaeota archaeon]
MVIDPSWKGLSEYETGTSSIERKGEILFSRIWIPNEKIFAIVTPRTPENPNPSMATFHNSDIVETFENYFRIVSPEDYGIGRPPN